MSRAYGWNAQLLIAEESEYGVIRTLDIGRYRLFRRLSTANKTFYHPMSWVWDVIRHSRSKMLSTLTAIWLFRWMSEISAFGLKPFSAHQPQPWLTAFIRTPLRAVKLPFQAIRLKSVCRRCRSLSAF